jgi:predicted Zn-dependent protease
MTRIKGTYEKILAKARERWDVLKLRGRIELLEGGVDANVKAIQTFEKAQQQYMPDHNGREDLELNYLLARAYFHSRQTGQAKMQLLKYKSRQPDFYPVRKMLAQVQIAEGAIAEARDDVDFLLKQAPNDPDVVKLALAVLGPNEQAEAAKLFKRLPDGTREEQLSKALIATLAPVSSPDEATRLYKLVLAQDGGDFEALQGLKEVLLKQGKKDEALALLKQGHAVAKSENAEKIALVIQQLEGSTLDEIAKSSEALIRKNFQDRPFELELKLYEFNLIKQDKAEAFKHLQTAEKLNPTDGRMADLMFQYHLADHNWDKANWYIDNILEKKNWDQSGGLIYRFRLAMTKNDIPAATDYARELTTKLKEFARSWVFYAQALQAARRFDDAIANYQVALEKQSENPEAIAGIITCYFQTNKPSDAYTYIQRGIKAHPQNLYFKEQWKNYQLQYGDPALAITPLREDRDANPKDPARWGALGRAQFAAARKKGKDWEKAAADAKATFTQAVKQWPGEELFWQFLMEIAQFNNDVAGSEALLKDMAARPEFKDSAKPSILLADHYLRNAKPDQAEATMKAALDRFSANAKESADIRRRLAAYYAANKRFDAALKLLDANSADKAVRQQMAEIYIMDGGQAEEPKRVAKFGEAERILRGMLAATPNDAQLNALLGVVLLQQKKEEQAMPALDAALAQDPKNITALFNRSQLLLKAKTPQVDEAIKNLSTLREVAPGNLEGRVMLAEALRSKGQLDQATRELSDALQIAPGRRDIRATLVGMYVENKNPSYGEAERLINQAKELEPREPLWPRMLAQLLSKRGMHQRAAEEIRAAMAIDLQNASTIQGYNRNGDLVRVYLDILETGKFYDQLLTETNGLFAQNKDMADTGWWVYVKRAVAQRNTGKPKEAMADFVKAIDIARADKGPGGQYILISIIDKIREVMSNESAIDRVTQLSENSKGDEQLRWKVMLTYLYFQNNDVPRAAKMLDDVRPQIATMKEERDQVTALNIAGNVYMMAEQFDKATSVYNDMLAKRPDDLGALNNMAMIMAEHTTPPNLPKAMEFSQRAYDAMVKRNTVEPNVLDTIGWVNVLTGGQGIDTGIDHLKNSINAGEIAEAQYHLGMAYLKKKFPDIAKQSLQRARDLITEKKGPVDEKLRMKVENGLVEVERALLEPRAGN